MEDRKSENKPAPLAKTIIVTSGGETKEYIFTLEMLENTVSQILNNQKLVNKILEYNKIRNKLLSEGAISSPRIQEHQMSIIEMIPGLERSAKMSMWGEIVPVIEDEVVKKFLKSQ